MKLSDEELTQIDQALGNMKVIFDEQMEKSVKPRNEEIDNELVKLLRENYITPSGLCDLVEDFGVFAEKSGTCIGGCAAPCKKTCVQPCKSAFRAGNE